MLDNQIKIDPNKSSTTTLGAYHLRSSVWDYYLAAKKGWNFWWWSVLNDWPLVAFNYYLAIPITRNLALPDFWSCEFMRLPCF